MAVPRRVRSWNSFQELVMHAFGCDITLPTHKISSSLWIFRFLNHINDPISPPPAASFCCFLLLYSLLLIASAANFCDQLLILTSATNLFCINDNYNIPVYLTYNVVAMQISWLRRFWTHTADHPNLVIVHILTMEHIPTSPTLSGIGTNRYQLGHAYTMLLILPSKWPSKHFYSTCTDIPNIGDVQLFNWHFKCRYEFVTDVVRNHGFQDFYMQLLYCCRQRTKKIRPRYCRYLFWVKILLPWNTSGHSQKLLVCWIFGPYCQKEDQLVDNIFNR
jgi:hypothetical protein